MSITGRPTPGFPWAFDNGAYGWAARGVPFDSGVYWDRLNLAMASEIQPDFAVIPDIPQLTNDDLYGGQASLSFSLHWLNHLPMGLRWYLAVQDGMYAVDVADALDDWPIDGLFMGGSIAFKRTAATWANLATERGIAFHYARASTARRIRHALSVGSDSCDSAQMLRRADQFRIATQAYYGGMCQGTLGI